MEPEQLLAPTVDRTQVPPLHQKRIVAFINHFLISSCSFLNEFSSNCESKFIELERKIQRLEAGLILIEAKLASIPEDTFTTKPIEKELTDSAPKDEIESESSNKDSTDQSQSQPQPPAEKLVRACEDVRYKKYFKMLQVGVPANAVKLKMQAEGVKPGILDTPNLELSDGVTS